MKSRGQTAAKRKIIVYIATSVDGYIARSDGSVDWLNRPMPKDGYGVTAFARPIDTILWGRKTYDFAAKMGGVGTYGKVKHYAFSRQPPTDPLPGVELVSESIERAREGHTDEELAIELGLSLSAIKKRWARIFERAEGHVPDFAPMKRHEHKHDQGRGAQKRHLLLRYVRNHPEELTPYDRDSHQCNHLMAQNSAW